MIITTNSGHEIEIDDDDFEMVKGITWYTMHSPYTHYAMGREKGGRKDNRKYILMHRLLTNAPAGLEVDHIDHNGLNNKRSNLRVCTRSQNQRNRLRHKPPKEGTGVYWHKKRMKWYARKFKDGKTYWIGAYETREDAMAACQQAKLA